MKVLFISEYILLDGFSGAKEVAKVHYDILCEMVGKDNIDAIGIVHNKNYIDNKSIITLNAYSTKWKAVINVCMGHSIMVSQEIVKYVLALHQKNNYDCIFLDNRILGSIAKALKKKDKELFVVTNFHGLSAYQLVEQVKRKKTFGELFIQLGSCHSERQSVYNSDVVCLMNTREYERFVKYYGNKKHVYIPCVLEDKFDKNLVETKRNNYNLLFVGGYFRPNNDGIAWFIKNVMVDLNPQIHLYIVGNNIESVKTEYNIPDMSNVHFIGRVDDLSPWYYSADAVIGPIFSGDGMKTKTAEAYMYGKKIIATSESLIGYKRGVTIECNDKDSFVKAINDSFLNDRIKFYPENRKIFEDNYSKKAIKKTLNKIIIEDRVMSNK